VERKVVVWMVRSICSAFFGGRMLGCAQVPAEYDDQIELRQIIINQSQGMMAQ